MEFKGNFVIGNYDESSEDWMVYFFKKNNLSEVPIKLTAGYVYFSLPDLSEMYSSEYCKCKKVLNNITNAIKHGYLVFKQGCDITSPAQFYLYRDNYIGLVVPKDTVFTLRMVWTEGTEPSNNRYVFMLCLDERFELEAHLDFMSFDIRV